MKDKRVFYILSLILCMMMIILLSGCGKSGARSGQANHNQAAVTENQDEESESKSATADNQPETGTASNQTETADNQTGTGENQPETGLELNAGDRVIYSVNTEADEGKNLRLDAVGRNLEAGVYQIREIRVYENGSLLQTISAGDAGTGDIIEAPVLDSMAPVNLIDMNFDGVDDLDLPGRDINNAKTITHYYWLWNPSVGEYLYGFTMRNAELHPETREIISKHNDGTVYYIDYYNYNNTALSLSRRELEDWDRGSEDFPLKEYYEYIDGEEVLIRQEFTDYDDNGLTIREIREPIDGVLYPVRMEELEVIDGEIRVIRSENIDPPILSQPAPEENLD